MKQLLFLILIVCFGCNGRNKPSGLPGVVDKYPSATIVCDSITKEYAVMVGDKYINLSQDGDYFESWGFNLVRLGQETIMPTYDSAFKIKNDWDSITTLLKAEDLYLLERKRKTDSIEQLRHKYQPCK